MMIELGQGWGIEDTVDGSRSLAASIVVIPFDGCAWVSMVLVLPQCRRRGFAGRLLRHALDWLHARGTLPVLDATPAGYPVYAQAGFVPTWGFQRYRREAASPAHVTPATPATAVSPASPEQAAGTAGVTHIRALTPADWPAIFALDAAAFGASRDPVLRRLADRLPAAARVAENAGGVIGFVFGRDGREACQLGPLLARRCRRRPGAARRCPDDDRRAGRCRPGRTATGHLRRLAAAARLRACSGRFTRMVRRRRTGAGGCRRRWCWWPARNWAEPRTGPCRDLLGHLDRAVEELVGVDRLDVEVLVEADVFLDQLRSRPSSARRRGCPARLRASTCRSSASRPAPSWSARCRT